VDDICGAWVSIIAHGVYIQPYYKIKLLKNQKNDVIFVIISVMGLKYSNL